jgi:hypothetical protein
MTDSYDIGEAIWGLNSSGKASVMQESNFEHSTAMAMFSMMDFVVGPRQHPLINHPLHLPTGEIIHVIAAFCPSGIHEV